MIRLKIIGAQWDIVDKLKKLKPHTPNEKWQITYATPIYGGWDIVVECKFENLTDLDAIVSRCRKDKEFTEWIEATTTLISTKNNFP